MVQRAGVLAALAALILTGPAGAGERPRVVSLDFCADQYVLALADRDQIAGLATGPDDAHSALRARAAGLRRVRDNAEDVLALHPDLIVRSFGGGVRAQGFYARAGLAVHDLGYAGSFEDMEAVIARTAQALGQGERGTALIAQMRADLAAAARPGARARALYLTPGGVTTGSGTLIHAMIEAAGLENAAASDGAIGWTSLPLEALVLDPPELIITGFFDQPDIAADHWSQTRHPVLTRLLERTPVIHLGGAMIGCGHWTLAEAARQVREQADSLLEPGS
ncbi:ABC transporter substrate-binding protein [Alkalicaulis satelles]|uniref:ABC transporter substrate-binding protein n=1 Tax=Alkalicaulis satelles TaxID=2609175 RepID=A0A5M6ZJQ5_9PROT|nr:ABC transporter substrate-binding protein [Alkalicaulis satelles]KAA5803964.1 ABC transporter substrate-binding protein [Alkalicaulis satelles]